MRTTDGRALLVISSFDSVQHEALPWMGWPPDRGHAPLTRLRLTFRHLRQRGQAEGAADFAFDDV